ncbi:hypothetical protein HanRHA438_Chr17g0807301 [Helianthus annuus]|nr:hypothetical protein HanRHA438_Chr17g0807301 [Helianthus annuus]
MQLDAWIFASNKGFVVLHRLQVKNQYENFPVSGDSISLLVMRLNEEDDAFKIFK